MVPVDCPLKDRHVDQLGVSATVWIFWELALTLVYDGMADRIPDNLAYEYVWVTELKSRKPTYQLRLQHLGRYLPKPRRLEATGETLEGELARYE
jgi:hypothetical protein